ncbi:MAG TPA: hypothetical protein DCL48_01920 [Alphaproteobacteria bacterium]|nr:hypothetical protein [Alphaproteobacteria bacterium]
MGQVKVILAILGALLVSAPFAHSYKLGENWQECDTYALSDPVRSIRACDHALNSGFGSAQLQARAHWSRARARRAQGDLDRALSDSLQAANTWPQAAQYWSLHGEVLAQMGQHPKAVLAFSSALLREAKRSDTLVARGKSYYAMQQYPAALSDFEAALALNPNHVEALDGKKRAQFGIATLAIRPETQPSKPLLRPLDQVLAARTTREVATGGRVALIIGNGVYRHTTALPNAVDDAADISAALTPLGYKVFGFPKVNFTRDELYSALEAFSQAAASAETAFVWYAGHGQEMANQGEEARNWLLPVDFQGGGDLDRSAVPMAKLLSAAQAARTLRVVVLDACRNNTLPSATRGPRGFKVEARSDMLIVYSTRAGLTAEDGEPSDRNSPFAGAFLETLKGNAQLDVRQFFGGVANKTRERTRHLQVPQEPERIDRLQTMATLPLAP